MTIDATTQPGYAGTPLIEINGADRDITGRPDDFYSSGVTVRGLAIGGFYAAGHLVRSGTGNVFEGNWLGLSPSGQPNPNADGMRLETGGHRIGGTTAAARNVMSGNTGAGLLVTSAEATGNLVLGNYIGTNPAGTAALPNAVGVQIDLGAGSTTLGGLATGARNVISGNTGDGVRIAGTGTANHLAANVIGTAADGTSSLGNGGHGVLLQGGGTRVGNLDVTAGNTIAFNSGAGVYVESGVGNAIAANAIHGNGSLGIDLAPAGITPNDTGDADSGPNNLLNAPSLASATLSGGIVTISGTLSPSPAAPYFVHFFASPSCDGSGAGEGQTLLAVTSAFTSNTGDTPFSTIVGDLPPGTAITATTTDAGNNTSEFSTCVLVQAATRAADIEVTKIDSPDPVVVGNQLTYTISVHNAGPDGATNVSVVDNLPGGVQFVSATSTQGTCSGTTTISCSLGDLASDATAGVTIVVTPSAAGTLVNTAVANATEDDPVESNNSATASTTVNSAPLPPFEVSTTSDSGPGSLRQAILNANAIAGDDVITFNIPGSGVRTIAPASPLPPITEAATVDGLSQPGWGGLPLVELDGTNAGFNANGLVLAGSGISVRGLAINRFGSGAGASGQGGTGILVQGSGARIQMNAIGTNPAGTLALGNRTHGIYVSGASGALIGGTSPFGNVVSGNGATGIRLLGAGATGATIAGNLVGVTRAGNAPLGNAVGIEILNGSFNTVGGGSGLDPNVVSGNTGTGIGIEGSLAQSNSISRNLIGTDLAGTAALGNGGHGVLVTDGASGSQIGGIPVLGGGGTGNVIRFNALAGVRIESGTGNAIKWNSIADNGLLGIDLGDEEVTANDLDDTDTGANGLVNFPILEGTSGGVGGRLQTTPNAGFLVDLYTVTACDTSGNGEGSALLARDIAISTDGFGEGIIPFTAAPAGTWVTATATDEAGNTSEFSACVRVPEAIVLSLPNTLPIGRSRNVPLTVTLPQPAPPGGTQVTVTSDNPAIAAINNEGAVSIAAGQVSGTATVRGVESGTTTLRATAPGYANGALSVTVTPNLVSTPATLSIPYGQTGTLPVSIGPDPAPAGGLTLDVVSDNPAIIEVVTPQISIAAGAFSANATVRGPAVGTASVHVSHPSYSPSSTVVTSSAALNIVQSSASWNSGLTAPMATVQLESNGTPVAAQPAVTVTLTAANPGCVSVPSSVTIPAGLVSATFTPGYGGVSDLPCTTTVTASAPSLTPDSYNVTVNPPPAINVSSTATVGAGLMIAAAASLGTSQHGGRVVTIRSSDPSRVLVSPDAATAGTASFTRTVANGSVNVPYYVQALEGVTGSTGIVIEAEGFQSGTHSLALVAPGIELHGVPATITLFSAPATSVYAQIGVPCSGAGSLCQVQNLRPGGPAFIVTLTNSNADVGRLRSDQPAATGQVVTKPIQPGYLLHAGGGVRNFLRAGIRARG